MEYLAQHSLLTTTLNGSYHGACGCGEEWYGQSAAWVALRWVGHRDTITKEMNRARREEARRNIDATTIY